jgi:predicted aspartyl protease
LIPTLVLSLIAHTAIAQSVDQVLDHVRTAAGLAHLADHANGITLRAAETGYYGEPFDWERTFDAHRFRVTRTGRLSEVHAYDGTNAWTQELGGETRVCELGDLAIQAVSVGIVSGTLLAEGTPVKFRIDHDLTDASQIYLNGDMDQGRAHLSVDIDRLTWRPRSWTVQVGDKNGTFDLEGSIEFAGIKFPHIVREAETVLTISKVEAAEKSDTRFRLTPGTPPDFSFDPAVGARVEAKTSPAMCLLVKPLINGKEVGWFLLDTGSQMSIIDPLEAEKAGLETFGNPTLTGFATHNAPGRFCRAKTLALGPLTIKDPLLLAGYLPRQAVGDGVVGVLGFPFFSRCVVEMEADIPRVSLLDSSTYKLPAGQWLPMHMSGYLPLVPGQFEAHAALFRLDTGAGGVIINQPAAREWKLREHGPISITGNDFVDGSNPLFQITAKSLGLGRCVGKDVPVRFATNVIGKFTDTYSSGVVGMGFGRAFVLVFDYPNRRIAAEPPASWPKSKD